MLLFMLYGQQVRVKPPWVWALQSHILAVPLILRTCPMCPVTPTSAGTGSVAWRPGTGRRWEVQVVFFDPNTLKGLKKKALLWAPKECGGEVRGASLGDPLPPLHPQPVASGQLKPSTLFLIFML